MKTIDEVLEEIPEWKEISDITYEPLNGGLSNTTYKVKAGQQSFVVRINGTQNEFLGLEREEEFNIVRKAAELGIGPGVLPISDHKNVLITEFISGSGIDTEQMKEACNIELVVATLLRIHAIQKQGRVLSPFQMIRKYIEGANKLGVQMPPQLQAHLEHMDDIEKRRSKDKCLL